MTPSRARERNRPGKRPISARAAAEPRPLLEVLVQFLVMALITCRWLVPTEASVNGETLWIVQLWLAAAIVWAWHAYREQRNRFQFDWWDVAAWTLVAGHVLAAVSVVVNGGEKRAALNMLWEWVVLGLTFSLVRRQLTSAADVRRLLLALVATAGMLAAWGLWQHFITIPQAVAEYDRAVDELEQLTAAPPPASFPEAASRQERVRQIQFELFSRGIPLEGPARQLHEYRLRSSREPFGPFALANTLAGLLVALLFVSGGVTWRACRRLGLGLPLAASAVTTALLAYCLFLTGSRTAYVGVLAGLVTAAALAIRRREVSRWVKGLSGGFAVAAVLAVLLVVNGYGGSRLQAAAEGAAKSFRYRMEYWTAAWEVAWERPLVGVGPGNFRQHYLEYKLPQSSEEIADPHNFILDLWTSGGALALVGLAALGVLAVQCVTATRPADSGADEAGLTDAAPLPWRHPLVLGAAGGFLLVLLVGLASGESDGIREAALLAGWVAAVWCLRVPFSRVSLSAESLIAALVGLMVHLLGAGGIEMPAITQIVLLLLVVLAAGDDAAGPHRAIPWRPRVLVAGVIVLSLFGLCLATATLPVMNRTALVRAGNASWLIESNPDAAIRHYRQAVTADPFSPDAAEKLSEVSFLRWESSSSATNQDFAQGVEFARIAIERNPYSPHGYRRLGNWYLKRFERTENSVDAAKGIEMLRKAVERYPTEPFLRAELALAFENAGHPHLAVDQAENALWLNKINREHLHPDKFLPYETAAAMRRIKNRALRQQRPERPRRRAE